MNQRKKDIPKILAITAIVFINLSISCFIKVGGRFIVVVDFAMSPKNVLSPV